MKYYVYTIIAIVSATVIAGFFIVGSPKYARLIEQDNQRISNLQMIQSEILNFWTNKARLPKVLSELNDSIRGVSVPYDPVSGTEYTYEISGKESFRLCAIFAKPSILTPTGGLKSAPMERVPSPAYMIPYGQDNWQHAEGLVCFDRKIDKELYPPIKLIK